MRIKDFLRSNINYDYKFSEFDFNLEDKGGHFKPSEYYLNIQEFMIAHKAQKVTKDFFNYEIEHSFIKTRRNFLLNNRDLGEDLIKKIERFSCFIYFITVKRKFSSNSKKLRNFLLIHDRKKRNVRLITSPNKKETTVEVLVYIGKTTNIVARYDDGHKATQKLNDPIYDGFEKRIYLANIWLNQERLFDLPYQHQHGNPPTYEEMPLDSIGPKALVDNILDFLESFLIVFFQDPRFNHRNKQPKISFEIDRWNRIVLPETIIISSFTKSLFFEHSIIISEDKIDNILMPVFQKNYLP